MWTALNAPNKNRVYIRKIILLLPYYYKNVYVLHTIQHEDKPLTTMTDLEQAHEPCGDVKLV